MRAYVKFYLNSKRTSPCVRRQVGRQLVNRNGVTDELFVKTQTIILTLSLRQQKASEVALTPSTLQP